MALNIKNERVHALAREAAARTGRSQTSVIEEALERYLAEAVPSARRDRAEAVRTLVGEFRAGLEETDRRAIRADLDGLYDEHGLPA